MSFRVRLHKVTKKYDRFPALKDFSETIQPRDRILLVGHNGAGKSTLLNLLATLTPPNQGRIEFQQAGEKLANKAEIRRHLAYLSHEPMMYPDLTSVENLRFVARMTQRPYDDEAIQAWLNTVGMGFARDRLFRTCSRGMQQRLSIARALLTEPELLLLDEPFNGLDQEGVGRLKKLFTESPYGWVLVTHDLSLGYELADRFWILKKGRLVHSLKKQEMSHQAFLQAGRGSVMAGATS